MEMYRSGNSSLRTSYVFKKGMVDSGHNSGYNFNSLK